MHFRISLGNKIQLKLTNLIFWTKFDKKGISGLKEKKVNTTVEFSIYELV